MKRLFMYVDKLSEYAAKAFAWLILPMVFALFYEVVARYVFNAPTIWSYDLTYMLYGALFIMASAYALSINRHVRIDVFYRLFPPRWKGIVDAALYVVLFFPVVGILLVKGVDYAALSWAQKEVSIAGAWRPPIYPLKTLFPVAMFILLLQGLVQFVRSLQLAKGGE
jgi:TRAP-type mannitol/chloroaromatic compound transport system permease small subunit